MILPTIRASLGRSDSQQLVRLLSQEDPELGEATRLRLEETGMEVYWTTRGSGTRCSPTRTCPSLPQSSSTYSCGKLCWREESTMRTPPTTSRRCWFRSVGLGVRIEFLARTTVNSTI